MLSRDVYYLFLSFFLFLSQAGAGGGSGATTSPGIPASTLVNDLAALWASHAHADITFLVDNEPVRAHKALLSNR